jgi:hypothetical protein
MQHTSWDTFCKFNPHPSSKITLGFQHCHIKYEKALIKNIIYCINMAGTASFITALSATSYKVRHHLNDCCGKPIK